MDTVYATTPFGRRPMTLGMIASQVTAKAVPVDASVEKWRVFHDIREAHDAIGATDRALAILNALLSFHPDTELSGSGDLIVFPSNEQLISRANGMSPPTLRRHLAVLVNCGLIIRKDSPNGKRFARKGRGGEIEQAYGFDLSPIVARAQEFRELAEAIKEEKRAYRLVKERISLLRRDIVKMIEAGIEEGLPADWTGFRGSYEATVGRLPRTASRVLLEDIAKDLDTLWQNVRNMLESFVDSKNMNANESQNERHIQNSNPDSISEIEQRSRNNKEEASDTAEESDNVRSMPKRQLPLGIVLDACPDMRLLLKDGEIRTWRDLMAAAALARPLLGISPSAYEDACAVLGQEQAAITMAAIHQRADQINSAGGYLRSLTERARDGKFSVWPMIMALARAKLNGGKRASSRGEMNVVSEPGPGESPSEFQISDALRRNIARRKQSC